MPPSAAAPRHAIDERRPRRRPARRRRAPPAQEPVRRPSPPAAHTALRPASRSGAVEPDTIIAAPGPRAGCASSTSGGRTPSSSDSGRSSRRCSSTGSATARISSGLTKSRPASAAHARAARSSACVARGPAPTRMASSARVRRTTCTAYSTSWSLTRDRLQRLAQAGQIALREARHSPRRARSTASGACVVQAAARQRKFLRASPARSS